MRRKQAFNALATHNEFERKRVMHASMLNEMKPAKPWYAHRWPWLLMLGPALVIAAGVHTMWLAFSRQDALVVDDYYKEGQAINQDLKRDRVAAGMKMALRMRYDAAGGTLSGSLSSLGRPRSGKIVLHLVHSTQPSKDMRLELQTDAQGNFTAALPMLEIAHWQVVVEDERRDWRLSGRWAWPQEKSVELKADRL
jgi:hypothetical protein